MSTQVFTQMSMQISAQFKKQDARMTPDVSSQVSQLEEQFAY